MDKNQKIAVGVIVIIAIVAAWQLGKNPSEPAGQNQTQTGEETPTENGQETEENENTPTPTPSPTGNGSSQNGQTWEGTLQASDNKAKGNYKISVDNHVIYIKTSRDYSSLVGKNVKVTYEGTLESFRLGDITEK